MSTGLRNADKLIADLTSTEQARFSRLTEIISHCSKYSADILSMDAASFIEAMRVIQDDDELIDTLEGLAKNG